MRVGDLSAALRHVDRRMFLAAGLTASIAVPLRAQPASRTADARAETLIAAARAQIGVTTIYDPAYVQLPYPGGDVSRERGVCTDVVVRAYRDAFGIDLQARVNADMRADFARYPTRWGLKGPDANIDHRRVPNLRVFLTRQGAELAVPAPSSDSDWQPGDLVTQELSPPGVARSAPPHIGIVSEEKVAGGTRRLVIHNIGSGTRAGDILASWRVTGRYRWLPV